MTPSILKMNSPAQQTSETDVDKNDASGGNDDKVDTMGEVYGELATKLHQKYLDRFGTEPKCGSENAKQIWIGIGGGPGSGKSTSAERVAEILNMVYKDVNCQQDEEVAVVIPVDGYHIPQKELKEKYGEDAMLRRGSPWTFDVEACVRDLKRAKEEGQASLPIYDREISDPRQDGVQLTRNSKFVFVEGLYLLFKNDCEKYGGDAYRAGRNTDEHETSETGNGWGELYDLWDEKWFIRAPSRDIQRSRLVKRSLKTWTEAKGKVWGKGEEGATKRVDYNDVKNMDLIGPNEEFADEVIVTK